MALQNPQPAVRPRLVGDSYRRRLIESALLELSLDGRVVLRADAEWRTACEAWRLLVDQQPLAVVLADSEADVVAVVNVARRLGVRVAPQSTGHNAAPLGSLADSILLRTSELRKVCIDPKAGVARVGAGATWRDVNEAAGRWDLAGLAGVARDLGVVGYLLGGGLSWFARSHGLAVNQIVAIELVTADGRWRRIDASHEPELFWAVRGGGGSFGIVTALEFRLFPIEEVYAGVLFWPWEQAADVLQAWRGWTTRAPEEITSIVRLLSYPASEDVPFWLRGRRFVMVEAVSQLSAEQTDELLAPLRALAPEADTFAPTLPADLWMLHADSDHPIAAVGQGALLDDLPTMAIDAILENLSPELQSVELRHLGGAVARPAALPGAVSAFDAGYALVVSGVAASEPAAVAIQQAADSMLEAITHWLAEVTYQNFSEAAVPGELIFGSAVYRRLQLIKDDYDPGDIIHANHSVRPPSGMRGY